MANTEGKIFNNKNGYFTEEELLEFKYMSDEEFYELLRGHKLSTWKCPPIKYKGADCFYCIKCLNMARDAVKEKKAK